MSVPTAVTDDYGTYVCHARFPGKEDQAPKTLNYFGVQGFGELPRLLMEYTETPYDSIMCFYTQMYKEFAPFGQLPCYKGPEVDNLIIAQSSAIVRHIARETGTFGNTKTEQAIQDMLFETGKDILSQLEVIHAEGPVDTKFDGIVKGVIEMMNRHNILSGENLGYGEISIFHSLHRIVQIKPDFLNQYDERLKIFVKKVSETPSIANYLKSPRRVPLTENDIGKGYTGMSGYKYITPMNPETIAKHFENH